MNTFNVFAYFWHEILAAKRTHSSVKLQELSDFVQIWHKNTFHAGMFGYEFTTESTFPEFTSVITKEWFQVEVGLAKIL
jgi:hypothetical protein